jgi:hypothetical protein
VSVDLPGIDAHLPPKSGTVHACLADNVAAITLLGRSSVYWSADDATAVAAESTGHRVIHAPAPPDGPTRAIRGHDGRDIDRPADAASIRRWEDDGGARESGWPAAALLDRAGVADDADDDIAAGVKGANENDSLRRSDS